MTQTQIRSVARLLALGTCLGLPILSLAAGGKNPPAAVTFRGSPGNTSTPPDRIHSDYAGMYRNGADRASVYFVANGNVVMDLASSTRTVYLDFTSPNAAANSAAGIANPPDLSGSYKINLSNSVYNSRGSCGTSTGLLGMGVGASASSCLWASFTDSQGRSWAVRFASANYPLTTDATATRIDASTWALETSMTATAVLILNSKSGPVESGYYTMLTKLTVVAQ